MFNQTRSTISVVVPCYNSVQTIEKSLQHTFDQTLSSELYEVIVVDDGSTDGTGELLQSLQKKYTFTLLLEPQNRGVAASRNKALQLVMNDIVVFVQDDIYVQNDFLQIHHDAHIAQPEETSVVVGFTYWYEGLPQTPFLKYLDQHEQFDYQRFAEVPVNEVGLIPADYLLFYTSNLSIKTSFIRSVGGFDESFVMPGSGVAVYEDSELAWRLKQRGMRVFYAPLAKAAHDHLRDLDSIKKRKYIEGIFTHLMWQKHPDFSWSGEKSSLIYNLTHLKLGALFSRFRFFLVVITTILFNPVIVFFLEKIAQRWQYQKNSPLLFKIVLGYCYNRGYWRGFWTRLFAK